MIGLPLLPSPKNGLAAQRTLSQCGIRILLVSDLLTRGIPGMLQPHGGCCSHTVRPQTYPPQSKICMATFDGMSLTPSGTPAETGAFGTTSDNGRINPIGALISRHLP
jgi:hypothetical protein